MSYQLPPNMLRLFQPRPQLPHQKNLTRDIDPRKRPQKTKRQMNGMAAYLEQARQDAADKGEVTDEVPMAEEDGEIEEGEAGEGPNGEGSSNGVRASNGHQRFTLAEQTRRELLREQKRKRIEDIKARGMASYDPSKDPEAQGDPFCTLFVSRLDFEVTEKDLHRTFDMYGPIQRIRIVRDKTGKSRGYAFVVYEKERDMRAAYKDTEGIKIKGRRAMVDVERGRTVRDWKPMRLGGGLGGLARKKKEPPPPEPAFTASRGGFRGGFRGGPPRGGGGFGARGGGRFGGPLPMGGGYGGGPPPMAAPGGYGMAPQGGFGGGYGAGNGGYGPPRGGGGDGYGRFDGPPAKRGRY